MMKVLMKVLHMILVKNIKFSLPGVILLLSMVKVLLMNWFAVKKYFPRASFEQNEKCNCSKCSGFCRSLQSKFALCYYSPYGYRATTGSRNLNLWSFSCEANDIPKHM